MVTLRVILAAAVILVVFAFSCSNDTTLEGRVDHKAITVSKDGMSSTLLLNTPGEGFAYIGVNIPDYIDDFPTTGSATVSEELANEIMQYYSEVNYLVNVDDDEIAGTTSYYVNREIFNRIEVGSTIKFKASKSESVGEIKELLS